MNRILKPFNIEKAKAGAKLSTKDGEDARIVCWDKFGNDYPTIALIDRDGVEIVYYYTKGGQNVIGFDSKNDLMIREDEYEDGDIIAFGPIKEKPIIGIFKYYNDTTSGSHTDYCDMNCNGVVLFNEAPFSSNNIRLATEGEKNKLFNALREINMKWNSDEKCIEGIGVDNEDMLILIKQIKKDIDNISGGLNVCINELEKNISK